MKRTKFILMAVVVALVLMGAGYAAWSQVFELRGTVSTGELFVDVTQGDHEYEVLDSDGEIVTDGELDTKEDYLDLSVNSSKTGEGEGETLTEINFTLNDMYPGTRVISNLKFTNRGTIKTVAALDEEDFSMPEDLILEFKIQVEGQEITVDGNNLSELLEYLVLEPNDDMEVTVIQEFPHESGNDTEREQFTWSVPIIFEQYNR
ncbi:MAG: hypothetical protein GX974_07925 [Clostridiales bacterium]|nr:hypothetical protein [Clostridiales bacterium]